MVGFMDVHLPANESCRGVTFFGSRFGVGPTVGFYEIAQSHT
jgi:hypothetical protein